MRLDIMANLLIIGAGGVGSVVAHKCAQAAKYEQAFSSITLASRTRAKKKPAEAAHVPPAADKPQTGAVC